MKSKAILTLLVCFILAATLALDSCIFLPGGYDYHDDEYWDSVFNEILDDMDDYDYDTGDYGYDTGDYGDDTGDNNNNSNDNNNNGNNNNNGGYITFTKEENFGSYYDDLTSTQKTIYEGISDSVDRYDSTVYFSGLYCTTDDVCAALHSYFYDHPEKFWLDNVADMSYNGDALTEIYLYCLEYFEYHDISSCERQLNERVDNVVSAIQNKTSSQYEQARLAHDYLVKTAHYDYDGLARHKNTGSDPVYDLLWTTYETMVNGKCICAGYAKSYKMILDRLGIPCSVVIGMAGECHAWNKIMLDGEGYYVDVTWDDAYEDSDNAFIDRTYYNAEPDYFESDHKEFRYTEGGYYLINDAPCYGREYVYYSHEGLVIDSYSLEALQSAMNAQNGNEAMYFKFNNAWDLQCASQAIGGALLSFDSSYYNYYYTLEGRNLIILYHKQ